MFCSNCAAEVLSATAKFCYSCGKELCLPTVQSDDFGKSTNELITEMFHRGFPYNIIVGLLEKNGYKMHLRTLKRKLSDMGLKRRENNYNEPDIERLIRAEIAGAGSLAGYRNIWHALRLVHHVHVPRSLVARLMKRIDPDAVQRRRARRLTRRNYVSPGPNFCWHIDGKIIRDDYSYYIRMLGRVLQSEILLQDDNVGLIRGTALPVLAIPKEELGH